MTFSHLLCKLPKIPKIGSALLWLKIIHLNLTLKTATKEPSNRRCGKIDFFTMGILPIELTFRVAREETLEIKVACQFLKQLLVSDRI